MVSPLRVQSQLTPEPTPESFTLNQHPTLLRERGTRQYSIIMIFREFAVTQVPPGCTIEYTRQRKKLYPGLHVATRASRTCLSCGKPRRTTRKSKIDLRCNVKNGYMSFRWQASDCNAAHPSLSTCLYIRNASLSFLLMLASVFPKLTYCFVAPPLGLASP